LRREITITDRVFPPDKTRRIILDKADYFIQTPYGFVLMLVYPDRNSAGEFAVHSFRFVYDGWEYYHWIKVRGWKNRYSEKHLKTLAYRFAVRTIDKHEKARGRR
jgi:hypothetical protein